MGNKKRGQVTTFMVLGMVILIIFAFIMRTSNEVQKTKFEGQAETITSEIEQSQSIQHYVRLCIKQGGEEGLYLMGQQGGRIYDYQGGNSPLQYTPHKQIIMDNKTINIPFSMIKPELNPPYNSSPYPSTPWYPEEFKNYSNIDSSRIYYLGDNGLPYLCDLNGPNSYNATKNFTGASCMPRINAWYYGISDDTIQIQLKDYTNKYIKECFEPGLIRDFSGMNVNVGEPNTTIIFGEEEVTFIVNFPLNFIFNLNATFGKKSEIITKKIVYSSSIPVRFKRVYDFASEIIDEDKNYIKFDIKEDAKKKDSYLWLNRVNQELIYEVSPRAEDTSIDMIRIVDQGSSIKGEPYTFQFLRQNRIPALDRIRQTDIASEYDLIFSEQTEIQIKPKGYDPDEDYYYSTIQDQECTDSEGERCMLGIYNYSGWKETDDYYFNYSCCITYYQTNPTVCLNDKTDPVNPGCVTRSPNSNPRNWTNSEFYKANSRDANYATSKRDIGYHEVNVSVCDDNGECDWQIVKILVYDIPKPVAKGINFFKDINQSYASDEDPYMLDATQSFVVLSIVTPQTMPPYRWCDNIDFPNCFEVLTPNVSLPNQSFSIKNITLPQMKFNTTGNHIINLTLAGSPIDADEMNVYVYQCLPHRNESLKPYPYHNFTFDPYPNTNDPFQADHTCCVGSGNKPSSSTNTTWGTIAGTGTTCYSLTEYGTYKSFNNTYLARIHSLDLSSGTTVTYPIGVTSNSNELTFAASASNLKNDIFKRDITRSCDGKRGNICNGTLIDAITTIECNDNNQGTGGTRKCSGPSTTLFTPLNTIFQNTEEPSCMNYPSGQTFESIFEGSSTNCNDEYACSEGENALYGTSTLESHFKCQASCDGNGKCTNSVNCIDCYSFNKCTDSDGTDSSVKGTLTFTNYDTCSDGECSNPTGSKTDSCVSTTILKEYICKSDLNQEIVYEEMDIDCNVALGAGCFYDNTAGIYKQKTASCSSGACVAQITDCYTGYACRSEVCAKDTSFTGLGCSLDSHCAPGYSCKTSTKECLPSTPTACTSDAQCTSVYYCNIGTGNCIQKFETGTECTSDNQCLSEYCKPTHHLGIKGGSTTYKCAVYCTSDTSCSSTTYCDTSSGNCIARLEGGETCSSDNQCLSGSCKTTTTGWIKGGSTSTQCEA